MLVLKLSSYLCRLYSLIRDYVLKFRSMGRHQLICIRDMDPRLRWPPFVSIGKNLRRRSTFKRYRYRLIFAFDNNGLIGDFFDTEKDIT
jgi:hypothetical protein